MRPCRSLPTKSQAWRPVATRRNCGSVVVHLECAVVEEAHQRVFPIAAVAERGAQRAATVLRVDERFLDEREERHDVLAE